jgi:endonuclease YncB( thermonuclease family)
MMRLVFRVLLLAFLAVGGNCFALDYTGRIVGVLDGDTVDLLTANKELVRVRLAGIDAPEKRQPFGNVAKKALSDLVFNRQAVVSGRKHDRYGRFLGKVQVSGVDANLQMVKRGFAWHFKKYEREQSVEDRVSYRDAEAAAREQRRGLWSDKEPIAPWEFRALRRGAPSYTQQSSRSMRLRHLMARTGLVASIVTVEPVTSRCALVRAFDILGGESNEVRHTHAIAQEDDFRKDVAGPFCQA